MKEQDARRNNGGSKRAGRPTRSVEENIARKLKPHQPEMIRILLRNAREDKAWAVKMFFEYAFGKPKDSIDLTTAGEKINAIFPKDFL